MTLVEAIEACRAAGAVLALDEHGPLLRGRVDPAVIGVLREHRDRVTAILRLREIHRSMGFDDADIALIEAALVSGKVGEVRLVVPAPAWARPA